LKKRYIIMFAVIAAIIIISYTAYSRINSNLEALLDIQITEIDPSSLEDGIYEGAYSSFPVQ